MHCSTNEQMIVGPEVFGSTVLSKAKLLKMQVDQPHIIDGLSTVVYMYIPIQLCFVVTYWESLCLV